MLRVLQRRIDAAPAAIGPGPVPGRARRQLLADQVDAGGAERRAAADSRKADPAPSPEPMPLDRFVGVLRTARPVPALAPDQQRQAELIGADQDMRAAARKAPERILPRKAFFSMFRQV